MAQGKGCSLFETIKASTYSRFTYCIFCEGKHKLKTINEQIEEPLNYLTMISECFKIEMKKECCKYKICESCIQRLKDAFEFKSSVEYANNILNQLDEIKMNNVKSLEIKSTSAIKNEFDESETSDFECDKNTNSDVSLDIDNSFPITQKPTNSVKNDDEESKTCIGNKTSTTAARLSCKMCIKTYRTKDALQQHVRSSHEGIKPFLCKMCLERFSSCSLKNKHMYEAHGWESRIYPCTTCGKMIYNASDLYKHIEKNHQNIKNFTCNVCNQQFYSKYHLKSHEVKHSGEKNFECNICSKSFARKATLTKHLKIHANIRDFECEYCGKTFIQKWSLQSHLKTHVKTKN